MKSAALCLIFLLSSGAFAAEPRVVGYFTEWGVYQRNFHVKDIPADKLTHINYAFAKIVNGQCDLFDSYAAIDKAYPGDSWEAGKLRGSFNQLLQLKKKHPGLKTLISVGGWTLSGPFSGVALTDASRGKFARSCVSFIRKYDFDGVDIDWEYPCGGGLEGNKSRKEDKANFTLLLGELRRELDKAGDADNTHYLLTIAAPAGPEKIAELEVAKIARALDWFNVMGYDFHGGWEKTANFNAPLYPVPNEPASNTAGRKLNVDSAIRAYLDAGAPADKLVLGVPFYGRGWNGVKAENDGLFQATGSMPQGTWEAGVFDYKDIAAHYLGRFSRHWNDDAKVPWLYDAKSGTMISYDDPQSLKLKAAYVRQKRLGGAMIWELSADDATGSLLTSLHEGLAGK